MLTKERWGTGSIKYDFLEEKFGVKGEDILPLWVADMDFVVASPIQEALIQAISGGILGYTALDVFEGVRKWQEKKDFYIERPWMIGLPNVVVGIDFALHAFTKKGDKVIVPSPVYEPFLSIVRDNQRTLIEAPFREVDGKIFFNYEKFDPEAKMILLCHPHNPQGRVWEKDELRELGHYCLKHNIIVVSDEIHSDFVFDGAAHYPFASLSKELQRITVTLNACSKTFNLAGVTGTAYALIADERMNALYRAQGERTKLFPSFLGQVALKAAYEKSGEWFEEMMKTIRENRRLAYTFFDSHDLPLKLVKSRGTYLLWIDFRGLNLPPSQVESLLLKRAKLALSNGEEFHGEGFFRMNLATSSENISRALLRLKEIFGQGI